MNDCHRAIISLVHNSPSRHPHNMRINTLLLRYKVTHDMNMVGGKIGFNTLSGTRPYILRWCLIQHHQCQAPCDDPTQSRASHIVPSPEPPPVFFRVSCAQFKLSSLTSLLQYKNRHMSQTDT